MSVLLLLEKLKKLHIKVRTEEEQLCIDAPQGAMGPELLSEIRSYKQELIHLLAATKNVSTEIPRNSGGRDLPVTGRQQSIWILSRTAEGSVAYHIPLIVEWDSSIPIDRIERSVQTVIDRHEVFRTSFFTNDEEELRQRVEDIQFNLEHRDVAYSDIADLDDVIAGENMRAFDLTSAPLIRGLLLSHPGKSSILVLTVHHIIFDGASAEILREELQTAYDAIQQDIQPVFSPLTHTYKDYSVWETSRLKDERHADRAFWKELLAGEWPVCQLSSDIRPLIKTFTGRRIAHRLSSGVTHHLQQFCQERRTSLFAGLLAAANALFLRYTGNEDLVTGTVFAGRDHPSLQQLIGLFINTVPIRTPIDPEMGYEDLLVRQGKLLQDAFAHQSLPFSEIFRLSGKQKDIGRSPLFDIMIIFNEQRKYSHEQRRRDTGFQFLQRDLRPTSQYDLTLSFNATDEGLYADIEFNTDVYQESFVRHLIAHYENLLGEMLRHPSKKLSRVDFLSPDEKHRLLKEWNDTETPLAVADDLVSLFRRQVMEKRDVTAVTFKGRTFTFGEIDSLSDQLGLYLCETYDISKGDRVTVLLRRGEWMIISLMAVLKCGCVYVPVDPAHPPRRVDFVKEDCGAAACIDEQEIQKFLSVQFAYARKLNVPIGGSDLAYVIYTSGSTGNPKGCMLEHRGIVNRIDWMWRKYGFDASDIILQKTTFTFDVSVWEIFMPLCWGAGMVICSEDDIYDPDRLSDIIYKNGITCLHFVPGQLAAFIERLYTSEGGVEKMRSLKRVFASGEALPPGTVRRWYERLQAPLVNLYGPTEASIDVSYYDTDGSEKVIPIGRPVANTSLYILDKWQGLLPEGVTGELCIGGIQLARGYLNRSDLTDQKFIPHPFQGAGRIYRTGDLARWLTDGNIQYLGRNDHQVKLRGFRIELGEIEHRMMELAEMNSVVVLLHTGGNGHRSLVAYFVAGKEYTPGDLQLLLKDLLPHYMIPSRFVQLERMPLTVNGKIDRDRLPSPEQENISGSDRPAQGNNEVEEKVREIWKAALGKDTIGEEDDFFFIGGDSINAVDMLGKVRKAFDREITVSNLYQYSTLSAFSRYIDASAGPLAGKDAWTRLMAELDELKSNTLRTHPAAAKIADIYPMTDIQKGMMIISLTNSGSAIYHDQFVYQVEYEAFDIDLFRKAFSLLVDKHETLRTGLSLSEDNDGEQVVYSDVAVDIAYEDLSLYSAGDQEGMISAYLQNELGSPFDLAVPPLWRVKIVKLGGKKIVYMLQFHHAILDGWSVAALNTELNELYSRLKEEPNYSPRRLKCTNKEAVMDQLLECSNEENIQFWRNELRGYRRMDLFTDMPIVRNFSRSYPDPYLSDIGAVIRDNNVSPKSLYFACFVYALHSISGQQDMTIGIVGNNRPLKEDGHSLLGCFLNTVPVRLLFPPTDFSWREYVQYVEDKLNQVARHDRMTLLRINEAVGDPVKRLNPFFDILFNYINFHIYDVLAEDPSAPDRIKSLADRLTIDNHELTNSYLVINVDATYKQLSVSYVLTRGMAPDVSLDQFQDHFDIALNGYLNNPDTPISESLQRTVAIADTASWWNVDEAF